MTVADEVLRPRRILWYAVLPALCLAGVASAQPGSGYVLGANDQVAVHALHVPEIPDRPVRIDASGFLTLPLAGRVPAASRTVEQLQTEIQSRLRAYIREPEVTVSVTEYRSQPVSVMGAVNNPGVYQIQGKKSLMEVLALAGGVRPDASDRVHITRRSQCSESSLFTAQAAEGGRYAVGEVKLVNLLEAKRPADNVSICPDDLVTVPRAPVIHVMGEVRKPGAHPLSDRTSLSVLEAVSRSEGLTRIAAPSAARILRRVAGSEQRQEIAVNVKRILDGKAADLTLEPDDILMIPNSTSKSAVLRGVEAALQMGTGIVIWRR